MVFQCWSKLVVGDTQGRWRWRFEWTQNWIAPFFSIAPEIKDLGWYRVVIHAKFGIKTTYFRQQTNAFLFTWVHSRCAENIVTKHSWYHRGKCGTLVDYHQAIFSVLWSRNRGPLAPNTSKGGAPLFQLLGLIHILPSVCFLPILIMYHIKLLYVNMISIIHNWGSA